VDPQGVSLNKQSADARQEFMRAWQEEERSIYDRSLRTEQAAGLCIPPGFRGAKAHHLAEAVTADVEALLARRGDCLRTLGCYTPGVCAAADSIGGALRKTSKAICKAATQAPSRRHKARGGESLLTAPLSGPTKVAKSELPYSGEDSETDFVRLGGFSGGYSGGMDAASLMHKRWLDWAMVFDSAKIAVAMVTACRNPVGRDIHRHLPSFTFRPEGPSSTSFDATVAMISDSWCSGASWLNQGDDSGHCNFMLLGRCLLYVGFYIPPANENHTDEQRTQLLDKLFSGLDKYTAQLKAGGAKLLVVAYGDLNPTPTILAVYHNHLRRRGLTDLLPIGTPTRVGGRDLDKVFTNEPALVIAYVHDGTMCRRRGCKLEHCGRLEQVFGTKDMDHHLVTIICQGPTSGSAGQPAMGWRASFVRDETQWSGALGRHVGEVCRSVAEELELWSTHAGTWKQAPESVLQSIVDLVAWIWKAAAFLAACRAGLIQLRPVRPAKRERMVPMDSLTADTVTAVRIAGLSSSRTAGFERAAKYTELCMSDAAAADTYLSGLLRPRSTGLPDYIMHPAADGERLLHGPAVVAQAAEHVACRGADRKDTSKGLEAQFVRETSLAHFRTQWRQEWECQFVPYSKEDLEEVVRALKQSKSTSELPYAVLLPGSMDWQGHRALFLAMHNLNLFMGLLPRDWLRQPCYGTHKPGRDPMTFSGCRWLMLGAVELRVSEELLKPRVEDLLWAHAGSEQMGRQNCLFAVYVEIETNLIRAELNLPSGDLWTDWEEAFATMPSERVVAEGLAAGISGHELSTMDAMIANPQIFVVKDDYRSEQCGTIVGIPEGRGLGPALFASGSRPLASTIAQHSPGLGLDPPAEGVLAYIMHREGSDGVVPDTAKAERTLSEIQEGNLSWESAMLSLPNDSTRLQMLDLASPTRIGATLFLDDSNVKGASRGILQQAAEAVDLAASETRAKVKHGKTKRGYTGRDFHDETPIRVGGGQAEIQQCRVSKGIQVDADGSMLSLIKRVENSARLGALTSSAALFSLHFTFSALLTCLEQRTIPKVLYGSEFLIMRPDFEPRLNALQDCLLRRTLGLQGNNSFSRAWLMVHCGWSRRLHAQVLLRALRLHAALLLCPEDSIHGVVLRRAQQHQETWANQAELALADLGCPAIQDWAATVATDCQSPTAVRRAYTKKILHPAIDRQELSWLNSQPNHPDVPACSLGEESISTVWDIVRSTVDL
jgi:hypothetical protein